MDTLQTTIINGQYLFLELSEYEMSLDSISRYRFGIISYMWILHKYRKNITNQNCLWWPCLLMDRDEMINLYRGPSIDASYQVSDSCF
jgi:hypothetical protein